MRDRVAKTKVHHMHTQKEEDLKDRDTETGIKKNNKIGTFPFQSLSKVTINHQYIFFFFFFWFFGFLRQGFSV